MSLTYFFAHHRNTYTFFLVVDASLHVSLGTYEFIAVTASLQTGEKLLEFLEADLRTRQRLMDETLQSIPRVFDVRTCVVSHSDECAHLL